MAYIIGFLYDLLFPGSDLGQVAGLALNGYSSSGCCSDYKCESGIVSCRARHVQQHLHMDVSIALVRMEIRVLAEWVLLSLLKGASSHHWMVPDICISTTSRPDRIPTTYPANVQGTPPKTHFKRLFPRVQTSMGISTRLRCAVLGKTHPGRQHAGSDRNANVGCNYGSK